jgi:TfoX/Sxy family transcriptional regulator of competence genes
VFVAFDEDLGQRVREALKGVKGVTERDMFGSLTFLVNGNMCCGVVGSNLIVRVGPELYHDALTRPHVSEMDMTGRPMKGMVGVSRAGVANDSDLALWVRLGLAHARSLPPKAKPKKKAAKRKAAEKPKGVRKKR